MGQGGKVITTPNTDQAKSYTDSLSYDSPESILTSVGEMIKRSGDKIGILNEVDLDFFKASTLNEFNNGALLVGVVSDEYRTFAIGFLRQLIRDYNCQTSAEKATAEVATINFVRVLDLNKQITSSEITHNALFYAHNPHPKGSFYGDFSGRCLACERTKLELVNRKLLSKELEIANRNYLASLQTLRMMKMAPLQVNINTNIGQNQIIQNKNA
jgi:hypothetical protein